MHYWLVYFHIKILNLSLSLSIYICMYVLRSIYCKDFFFYNYVIAIRIIIAILHRVVNVYVWLIVKWLQSVVVKAGHHHITFISLCLSPQPQKPAGIDTEGPHSSLFRLIKTFAPHTGLKALIKGQWTLNQFCITFSYSKTNGRVWLARAGVVHKDTCDPFPTVGHC